MAVRNPLVLVSGQLRELPTGDTVTGAVSVGAITSSGLTASTSKILGRTTAGTGAIEEISVGTGLTLSAGTLSATGAMVVRALTTDATPTVLTSDQAAAGTTNQVILTDNQAMTFNSLITARQNATGDTAAWNITGCIKRGSGVATTTLVGTPTSLTPMADTGAAAWTVALTADTTNGGLKITVTGEASKTIRWSATVYTNELAG
jgi:hypothetical protein